MQDKKPIVLLILIIVAIVANLVNIITYKKIMKSIKLNSAGACMLADTTTPPKEALEIITEY